MIEFFIALFGGLYYAGKSEYEKSKERAYDDWVSNRNSYIENLKKRVCLSPQEEYDIQNYILSGENFEKICNDFAKDFKFVFGGSTAVWKKILRIPPRPPVLDPKIYKHDAYSFLVPANHIYWVYRLILASRGKVDNWMLFDGYMVGDIKDRKISLRFAQCIERHLIKAGVKDACFVLEQGFLGDTIKFNKRLCIHPYSRVW